MEFNPQDADSDRAAFTLLPEGLYDIEVVEAEERTSKKGNPMIALTLEARHPDGYPSRVWDWLVSTPAAVFKIRQFCDAAGLSNQFQSGRLTVADCHGRKVQARIVVEEGRDGYQDRNSIAEYVVSDSAKAPAGISTMPQAQANDATHADMHADLSDGAMAPEPAAVTEDEIPF